MDCPRHTDSVSCCTRTISSLAYLRGAPLQTHHKARDATDAENTTNIIDALQDMGGSVLRGQARGVMVAEHAEKKANEVPDTDKDAVEAPVARLGNELSVQD